MVVRCSFSHRSFLPGRVWLRKVFIKTLLVLLFFLSSPSQSYYGGPGPYSNYQQPINININLGGYPGSYSPGYYNYLGYSPSGYVGGIGPYGNSWVTALPPTSALIAAASDKFSFFFSNSDDEYIYVSFDEDGGQDRGAIAILGASGSDDYEYLSHVTLGKDDYYVTSANKIIVKDDLLVIGTNDEARKQPDLKFFDF